MLQRDAELIGSDEDPPPPPRPCSPSDSTGPAAAVERRANSGLRTWAVTPYHGVIMERMTRTMASMITRTTMSKSKMGMMTAVQAFGGRLDCFV